MNIGLFKKQVVDARDLEFMADTSAAVLASSPKSGRLILWLIVLLLVVVSIWASKAQLEEVTIGGGKIIPSSQVQVVQNLEGGILAEILVSEGDVVAKDQVILRIDDTRFAASFRESSRRSDSLNAKVIRLKAEAEGQSFNAPKEITPAFKKLLDREFGAL